MDAKTEAYLKMRNKISDNMEEVLGAIKTLQPCTYTDVSEYLERPINSITNRISELVKIGLIDVGGVQEHNGYNRSLFVVCDHSTAKNLQNKLLQKFISEKKDLEDDLGKFDLSEKSKNLLKVHLADLYVKLRRITRFRVIE